LSLASTASAVPGGPAVNLPTSGNGDGNVFLSEEEIRGLAQQLQVASMVVVAVGGMQADMTSKFANVL
jgi:hypothetical protein